MIVLDLKEDERLDYLLGEPLRIIQSPSVFAFSLDAVLLAHFTYVPILKGNLVDLCSGNGVIPLLLSRRTKGTIKGIEIQERLYDMAVRSIEYNDLSDRVKMIHADLKEIPKTIGHAKYDVVTCNPPYFPAVKESEQNANEYIAIARHEIMCTLEDVIRVSSQLLKQGGKAAFVHRPGRLLDILTLMRTYKLEPKRLQFVYPKHGKEANTVLIEGIKEGRADLKLLPPLTVYDEKNEYTDEMRRILNGSN